MFPTLYVYVSYVHEAISKPFESCSEKQKQKETKQKKQKNRLTYFENIELFTENPLYHYDTFHVQSAQILFLNNYIFLPRG